MICCVGMGILHNACSPSLPLPLFPAPHIIRAVQSSSLNYKFNILLFTSSWQSRFGQRQKMLHHVIEVH